MRPTGYAQGSRGELHERSRGGTSAGGGNVLALAQRPKIGPGLVSGGGALLAPLWLFCVQSNDGMSQFGAGIVSFVP